MMFLSRKKKQIEEKKTELRSAGLVVDLRSVLPEVSSPPILKTASLPVKPLSPKPLSGALKMSLSLPKETAREIKEAAGTSFKKIQKEVKPKVKRIKKNIKALRLRKKYSRQLSKMKELVLSAKPNISSRHSWYDFFFFLKKKTKRRRQESSPARSALSFLVFLLILIIPFKIMASFGFLNMDEFENRVMGKSLSGLNSLLAAADSASRLDLKTADSELALAGENFLAAQEDLNQINDAIFSLVALSSDPKLKLAANSKKFLSAGVIASSLGRNLVQATDKLFSGQADFKDSLESFLYYGRQAADDAKRLENEISKIEEDSLPEEYQEKFSYMKRQAGMLAGNLGTFVEMAENLKELLGLSHDRRYLLIFQNNSEMRASGGFLGSYALVDISGGKIKNLEVPAGGSYDLEAGLKGRKLIAPKALWLVNPHWNFWDANWWPDWPKTARFLMDFYEDSEGPSVDGVISLTPTVVEKMLEISGPIDMSADYGIVITSENFWESVQKIVEYKNLVKTHPEALSGLNATTSPIVASLPLKQDLENNSDNKPKKIIGDLMARLLEILPQKLNRENLPAIAAVFEESVKGKHVLFYFKDEKSQMEMLRRGLAGEIKESSGDYLMIVDTNIAGQKTDRLIDREASLETEIMPDGSIVDTLRIKRTHQGIKNEALTGVRNVNWLRVYVPSGSELIAASGFAVPDEVYFSNPDETAEKVTELAEEEAAFIDVKSGTKIYQDSGKTVFANWTMLDPGQSEEIVFKYKLPFNLQEISERKNLSWLDRLNSWLNPDDELVFPYSLLIQKQPGSWPIDFSILMAKPDNYEVLWRQEDRISDFDFPAIWHEKWRLDGDNFTSVLLKKEK